MAEAATPATDVPNATPNPLIGAASAERMACRSVTVSGQARLAAKTPRIMEFLKEFSFSPSSINTYMINPYAFYTTYVLGLREEEDLLDEPDAALIWRGTLAAAQFEVAVPADAPLGIAKGRIRFSIAGVPAGTSVATGSAVAGKSRSSSRIAQSAPAGPRRSGTKPGAVTIPPARRCVVNVPRS